MKNLKQIGTHKLGKNPNAVVLQIGEKTTTLSHASITSSTLNTPEKLKAALVAAHGKEVDVFFHINRDGSLALATGKAPKVWPEDESKED